MFRNGASSSAGKYPRHAHIIRRRLNDEGNSIAADASKLPFVDIDVVSAFLTSGLRVDSLEQLVLPTSSTGIAHLARALQDCCGRVFSSVPDAVSSTCVCQSQHALLSRSGDADLSRMTTFGTFDYACVAPGDSPEVGNELCIARHAFCDHTFLEAALVRFSPGDRIVDAQFYRDARLLVLVNDSSGSARLDMLDCGLLSYAHADADTVATGEFSRLTRVAWCVPLADHARLRRSMSQLRRGRYKYRVRGCRPRCTAVDDARIRASSSKQ